MDLGIEAVVELAREESPGRFPRDLTLLRFPLDDGTGNSRLLLSLAVETTARLIGYGVPTFIYCGAGLSRTPAIAAMAIALVEGKSPEECLAEILAGRPGDVSPGLWSDLQTIRAGLGGPWTR